MENQPIDLRRTRRKATAACVVTAPVLVGIVRGFYPSYKRNSTGAVVIPIFRAHLLEARVELAACLLAALVLPFFVLGLYRLSVRRAPLLAALGGVVGLLGWMMIPFLGAPDALAYELARHGGQPAVYDHFANHDTFIGVGTAVFLVGHEIGTIILGAALWRAGAVRPWAASLFVVAPVAHLAAVLAGSRGVDVAAFILLTVGAAVAARAIIATPDDQWDLPPAGTADLPTGPADPKRINSPVTALATSPASPTTSVTPAYPIAWNDRPKP